MALAQAVAAQHGALVTALYASAPTALSLPLAMAQSPADMLPMLQQLDIDYRDEAKARVARAGSSGQSPIQWRELGGGALAAGFAAHALCCDLLVLGQPDPADALTVGVPAGFVESVLLASGKPGLVLPCVGSWASLGQAVLIAWNATRESAHAVSAAMPFLRRAARIHVAVAEGCELADQHSAQPRAAEPRAELEDYLRMHGVEAPIERHPRLALASAGSAILSLAGDVGADLLVMGCYGHGRAREWVMGGASRTALASMTLPVLMAH